MKNLLAVLLLLSAPAFGAESIQYLPNGITITSGTAGAYTIMVPANQEVRLTTSGTGKVAIPGTLLVNALSATTANVTSGTVGTLNVTGSIAASGATATTANDVANVGTLDTRYWSTVYQKLAGDVNYTSTTTPADVSGLSTVVVSGATYFIELQSFASVASGGAAAGGLALTLSGPSTSSVSGIRFQNANNGPNLFTRMVSDNALPTGSFIPSDFSNGNWTSGLVGHATAYATFSASGTLKVQACQHTSSGTATKLWAEYTWWTVRRVK